MDTNNRQNWSTQRDEGRTPAGSGRTPGAYNIYSAAQAQLKAGPDQRAQHARFGDSGFAHARSDAASRPGSPGSQPASDPNSRKSLDQNVAFGTTDKPEGFVTTWKKATHTWRWRAVLCVFLALLLMMMQPSGNALFRSWNASTGEMTGLAAAIGVGGDDADALTDNPADTQAGSGDTSTNDNGTSNDPNIVPGTAEFMHQSSDDGEGAKMGAAESTVLDYLTFGTSSKVYLYGTVDDSTPKLRYSTGPGSAGSYTYYNDSTDTSPKTAYLVPVDPTEGYDYIVAGVRLGDSVYNLTADPAKGMFGAVNTSWSGTTDLNTGVPYLDATQSAVANGDLPTDAFTALGYTQTGWVTLNATLLDQVQYEATRTVTSAPSGTLYKNATSPRLLVGGKDSGNTAAFDTGRLYDPTSDSVSNVLNTRQGVTYDTRAYALWAPTTYTVQGYYSGTKVFETAADSLQWDSPLKVTASNTPENSTFSSSVLNALNSSNVTWVVMKQSGGSYVTDTDVRGIKSDTDGLYLYDLLNPHNLTKASVDPAGGASSATVRVEPKVAVNFYAGTGTGGRSVAFDGTVSVGAQSISGYDLNGNSITLTDGVNGVDLSKVLVVPWTLDSEILEEVSSATIGGYHAALATWESKDGKWEVDGYPGFDQVICVPWESYATAHELSLWVNDGSTLVGSFIDNIGPYDEDDDYWEGPNGVYWDFGYFCGVPATDLATGSSSFTATNVSGNFPTTSDVGANADFQGPTATATLIGWNHTAAGAQAGTVEVANGAAISDYIGTSLDWYAVWQAGNTYTVTLNDSNGGFTVNIDGVGNTTVPMLQITGIESGTKLNSIAVGSTWTAIEEGDQVVGATIEVASSGGTTLDNITKNPTAAPSATTSGYWSDGSSIDYQAALGDLADSVTISANTSLTYTHTADVTFEMAPAAASGTFTSPSTGNAVTVTYVPYGTQIDEIGFEAVQGETYYIYSNAQNPTYSFSGLTPTSGSASYSTGSWAIGNTAVDPTTDVVDQDTSGTLTLTYTFANLYDVMFMQEDGTTQIGTTQHVASGSKPIEPAAGDIPAKTGDAQYSYAFDGWRVSTDSSASPTLYGRTPDVAFDDVSGNVTYVAHYAQSTNEYTVTWKTAVSDENALEEDTVAYGGTPSFDGTEPTKAADAQYTYAFDGWQIDGTGTVYNTTASGSIAAFPTVAGDVTYVAHFVPTTRVYDVTLTSTTGKFSSSVSGTSFSDKQTVVIKDVPYGTAYSAIHFTGATVDPSDSTKVTVNWADGNSGQTIDGLTKAPASAAFGGTPKWTGTNIANSGGAVSMAAATNSESSASSVTGAATLTLAYEGATYTVTFNNYNDSQIKTGSLAYGAQPSCDAPTRTDSSGQYTYTFAGWKSSVDNKIYGVTSSEINDGETHGGDALPTVSENVTYTAQFKETVNSYTITWVDGNGDTLHAESLEYGATPAYSGTTPTKTDTTSTHYTFNNTWSPAITIVTGNATYTAQFDESTRQYTVNFYEEDGTTAVSGSPFTLNYGDTLSGHATAASKAATATTTYTFDGWLLIGGDNTPIPDANLGTVTGDASYKAHYAESTRTYDITVSLLQNDGTTAETGTYNGHTGSTFTIEGVPYNVAFSSVKFNWKGETSGTADYTKGTYSATGSNTATTTPVPSTGGQNTSGVGWNNTTNTPVDSTAFTYTFGVDSYTVTYIIDGGTWAAGYTTGGNVTRSADGTTLTQAGYSYGNTVNNTNVPSNLANYTDAGDTAISQSTFTPASGYTKTVTGGTTFLGQWYTRTGSAGSYTYTAVSGTPYGKQVTSDVTYVYALTPVHNVVWKKAVGTDADDAAGHITDIRTDQVYGTDVTGAYPDTNHTTSAPEVASPGSGYNDRNWYTGTAISDSTMGTAASALGTSGTITPTGDLTYTRYFKAADVTYYIVIETQSISDARIENAKAAADRRTNHGNYTPIVLQTSGAEGTSASGITVPAGTSQDAVVRAAVQAWATANADKFSLSDYEMNWAEATTSDGETFTPTTPNGKGAIGSLTFTPTATGQAILVYFTRDKHTVTERYTYTEGSSVEDEKPSTWINLNVPNLTHATATDYYYGEAYTLTNTSTYTPTNGYTFGGWKADGTGDAVAGGTMGTASVTYVGDWTRNDIDVIVHNADPSSGSITVAGATVTPSDNGETLTVSGKYKYGDTPDTADFTKAPGTGRAFSDWYTGKTSTTPGSFSALTPATGTTVDTGLWAQWVQTFAITYTAGAHAGSNFHGWTTGQLTQGTSLEDYAYTDGTTKAGTAGTGDGVSRATSDITTAEAGYEFASWSWEIVNTSTDTGSWLYDASTASTYLDNPVYASGTTTLTGGITITANYQGTAHTVTLANNLDNNKWAGVDPSYAGTGTLTDGATVRTGDTIKLPTASQLERTGYTLTSYTIEQTGADYGTITVSASSSSNIEKTVLAGTSPYKGDITVTANYTPKSHAVSFGWKSNQSNNQVTAPTTLTTSAATTATFNQQYTIPADLYTTNANIPAGHTLNATPVVAVTTANAAACKAGTYTPDVHISGDATHGFYIAAGDVPDADFTILTVWDINTYWVTWELSAGAKADYAKDAPTNPDKLTWSLASGTQYNDTVASRVSKSGTYVEYGTAYADLFTFAPTLLIGDNLRTKYKPANQATWAPLMTSGGGFVGDASSTTYTEGAGQPRGEVHFVLTPAEYTYNVVVSVENGTATIGSTTDRSLTFSYNTAYNTAVKDVTYDAAKTLPLSGMTVARTDDNYEANATWTLQVNTDTTTGTPAAASAPMESTTPVTGYMNYTATFAQKSYTLNYTLAEVADNTVTPKTSLDSGATMLSKITDGTVYSGKTMTQSSASAPVLQNETEGFVAAKYGALTWYTWDGTNAPVDVTTQVNAGSLTLNDSIARDDDNDGKMDSITLYAVPSVNNKTVTVTIVNGTTTAAGSATTYTNANVPYGTKIGDILTNTEVANFTPSAGASHNTAIAVWSNTSGSFLANDVVGLTGLSDTASAPGNTEVTGDVNLTLAFPAMRTITYEVAYGKWSDNTTAAKVYYVPDGYTLATYYTTAADDDDSSVRHSSPTGLSVPSVGSWPGTGYSDQNDGTWTRTSGSTGIDPTTSANGITDSLTAKAEGNVTYQYAYDPLRNLSVTVNVHYQNATTPAAAYRGIASDYGTDVADATVTLTNQTFGDTITVADLLAAISNDEPAAGYIKVPVGFKRELADHSGDSGLSAAGVASTTSYVVQAANNEFDVYLDRYLVDYTYAFESYPTGFDPTNNPVTPQQARYGEEVALWTTTQTYVSSNEKYAFQGWTVPGDATYYKGANPKYPMTPAASNNNTTFATTAFTGHWAVASYEVNYVLLGTDSEGNNGLNALHNAKLVNSEGETVLAKFDKAEYDTEATLNPTSELIGSKPTGSAVTLSNAKKYKKYGWVYSKDGGATWVKKEGTNDYLVLESPADVPETIEDDNFVFAPITQIQRYSVTFRAGPYAQAQLNGGEALEGVLDFSVKYGDPVPNSPWYNTGDVTEQNASTNERTLAYLQSIGFNENGCVPLNVTSFLRMFKQQTATDVGNRSNWQAVNDTAGNILEGDLVGGNIEYQWKFPDQTYTIYFMGIEGTDLLAAAGDVEKYAVGSYTALQWAGVPNGSDQSTNTITWEESIFEEMDNDSFLGTVKTGADGRTVNAWMNPAKNGATFAGWVIGTAEKPADVLAMTPNTDIAVKDIWASGFNNAGGSGQQMYVWATWENNPATLTYHNNFTNVELDGKHYANEGQNLTTATTKTDKTKAHNGTLTTNTTATLTTLANLGDDFNPTGYTFVGWTDRENADTVEHARRSNQSGGTLWADGGSYNIGTTEAHDLYAVYSANTFKVQWTDFGGNKISVKQAYLAGAIPDVTVANIDSPTSAEIAQLVKYGYSTSVSDPFTQEFTYNATTGNTLANVSAVFTDDDTKAVTNPNGRTFVKWRYNTTLYSDGDNVSTGMATEQGTLVVLEPTAKTQYTLTYVYSNGTTTTVDETHDVLVSGDTGYDAHPNEAPFSLTDQTNAVKDTYTGYTLTGWKMGSTTYGLNDTVYLNASNTTGGKAQIEAQWEASNANFTVVRHYPKGLQASDGEVTISTADNLPVRTTGSSSTITSAEADAFVADDLAAIAADTTHATYGELASYETQSYAFDKSECSVTSVAATGTTIHVYYKLNTITLTYKYSGVTGYDPNPKTQTIIKGTSFTLPVTEGTLPANRAPKGKWKIQVKNGNNYTMQDLGDPGETITNANANYPTANSTIILQTEAAKHTVEFVPDGTTAKWADDTTVVKDQKVESGKKPTSSLVPELKRIVGSTDDTYELVWTSSLTGAAADPFNTTVNEPVTYTASYKLINVVNYSLGEHAAYAATNANDVTSYTGLASEYDMATGQKADSGATPYGLLKLVVTEDPGITATGGKPTAAAGWEFVGWEMTDNEGTVVKTAAELPDLSNVYALANLEKSYTFTAIYQETEQRVTFVASADGTTNPYPNESGFAGKEHSSAPATNYVWGYTASDKSAAKRASDSALPDSYLADGVTLTVPSAPAAAPGYEFAGWQGSIDGVSVTLGTTSENMGFTIPKEDTTLYAVYEPIGVELNFESANAEAGAVQTKADGTVVANSVTTEALSSVVYTSKAIPQPGKKFTGWVSTSDLTFNLLDAGWYAAVTDKTDAAYGLLTVGKSAPDTDNDIPAMYFSGDYQATFADDPYEVTFVGDEDGKLTVTPVYYGDADYQAVKWGQKPTLGGSSGNSVTVTPVNAGYSFSHWEYTMEEEYLDGDTLKVKTGNAATKGTTLDPTTVAIKGDTVFTAVYTENMGSLVFMPGDAGSAAEGSTTGYTEVRPGVEVDIPDCGFTWAGHTFQGWTLDPEDTTTLIQPTSVSSAKYTTKGGAEVMYAVWSVDKANVVYHNGAIADDVTKFTTGSNPDSAQAQYTEKGYFVANFATTVEAPGATDYTTLGASVWADNDAAALAAAISGYGYMTSWDGVPGYIRFDTRVPGYARTLVGWATTEGGEVVYTPGQTILAADMPTGKDASHKTIDLYAVWTDTLFTVSLNGGGARTIDATKTADKQVAWGKSLTIAAVADMYQYNRHDFSTWTKDANATSFSTLSSTDGSAFTFTFRGTGDTTLTAEWTLNSTEPQIMQVVFHDMKANNKTLGTAGDRAWSDMPMANGTYANQIASPAGYYSFRGWYITAPSQGGTEPDATFAKNYGIGDWDGTTFTFDNAKSVEWILQKYYNEKQPLKNKVGQYVDNPNPPIYWNSTKVAEDGTVGDWTDEFWDVQRNNQKITIDVYGWADLQKYDVNFKANAPASGLTGTTETPQTLDYKSDEAQTLNANGYEVPGYTFAYWLKPSGDTATGADAEAGTLSAKLANGTTSFTGQRYDDEYTVAANASLLTTSEVNTGAYQVNLYAMWNESYDNKVIFNETYEGDGASDAAVSGHATATISGLAWNNGEVTDHPNATIVLPGQAGYGGATVTGSGDPITATDGSVYPGGDEYWNYVFDGWWTSKDDTGVRVTPGTDTMATAVTAALANDPTSVTVTTDANGVKNYTLTLYAHWTATSATVKYDLNGGEPTDSETYDDETKGLGSDSTQKTSVSLKDATKLKKLGQKATGWTASDGFYAAAGDTAGTVYGTTVAFPNSLAGEEVTMTANFVPRAYTVEFNYAGADTGGTLEIAGTTYGGASDSAHPNGIPGLGYSSSHAYRYGGNETAVGWNDGYAVWPADMSDPVKEGYAFAGYTVPYGNGNTMLLTAAKGKGWTVKQLAEAISAEENPTLSPGEQKAAADDVRGTQDATVRSYELTASWTANKYTVVRELGGAKYGNDTTSTLTGVEWSDKDLLLDESAMTNPGYSNVKWYITNETDPSQRAEVTAEDPSLDDLMQVWKTVNEGWTTLPSTLTVHAEWEESKATISFTLDKTAYGKVSDGTTTATEIEYIVGSASGYIYTSDGAGGLMKTNELITSKTVMATIDTDYQTSWEVTGWSPAEGNTAADTTTQFKLGTFNGSGEYTDKTYVAQVSGKSYGYTVTHLFQDASGSFTSLPTVTAVSAVDENGGSLEETGTAAYGTAYTRAELAKTLDGFTLDESGAGLTIGTDEGQNVIELKYNRAQHDLSFNIVVVGGSSTPAAPAAHTGVYYQHEEALPGSAGASDDLPTVPGYRFKNWYENYGTGSEAIVSGDTYTMPDSDVTLTAVYEVDDFEVTIVDTPKKDSGTVNASGDTIYEDADSSYGTTVTNAVEQPVKVVSGKTLGDTGLTASYNMVVGPTGNAKTLGTGETLLSTVTCADNVAITWLMTTPTGEYIGMTDDPTTEVITQDTYFTPIVSKVWLIKYLPGTKGDFKTSKAAGTLIEIDPDTYATTGYSLLDYLYPSKTDYTVLPAGKPGYEFAGWHVAYGSYDSGTSYYTNEQLMANAAEFGALKTSITLTAQWQPGESYVLFDLNAPAQGVTSFNTDPSGNYTTESQVPLPATADTDADGYTLSKWTLYAVDDTGAETKLGDYAAGGSFEMPGSDSTEENPKLIARATWTEGYATITYVSNNTSKGTVTTGSEQIGFWTGTPKTGSAVKGSVATPVSENYTFEGWTVDGAEVTTDVVGTIAKDDLLKDTNGKYLEATYTANFKGVPRVVQFLVADDSFIDAEKTQPMGQIWGYNSTYNERKLAYKGLLLKQTVEYGDVIDIAKYGEAVPETNYKLKNGNCWDYATYDSEGGTPGESGAVTDSGMRSMPITAGYTVFTVHFVYDDGDYTVNWWGRNGGAPEEGKPNFTSKSTWGRTVSTTRTVSKVGYVFTGWFTDIPPADLTVDDGSVAYDQAPGSTMLEGQSYGTLAGGTYATEAPDGTKDHIDLRAGWRVRSDFSVVFNDNAVDESATTPKAEASWTASNVKWVDESAGYTVDSSTYTAKVTGNDYLFGYEFDGWWTQREGGTQVFDASGTTTAQYRDLVDGDESVTSVTLFAHWTPKTYYVAYQSEWGFENEYTYGSGTADDPYVVYGFTIDGVDAVYPDGVSQSGLTITPPTNTDDNWGWKEWQYLVGAAGHVLPANWTVRDLKDAGAATVTIDGKTCYLIKGVWNSKVVWETVYELYENNGTPEEPNLVERTDLEEIYKDKLTVRSYGMEGDVVSPNLNYKVPGFMSTPAAAQAKTLERNGAATLDDVKATLVKDPSNPSKVTHTFYVAMLPMEPYTLTFDLNDAYPYTDNGYTHAATMTTDPEDGEVATITSGNVGTISQDGKNYLSIENTPHYDDPDNEGSLLYYQDPTRPGFKFGGWFNVAIDDASGTGVGAVAVKVEGGETYPGAALENQQTLYGDLARDDDGEWFDPGIGNGFTLHAMWTELTRTVYYSVATDQADLVKIRLNSEDDSAYSTAERTEVIGAATGDKFSDDGATRLVNADGKKVAQGAVAIAARGYHAVWRVVSAGDAPTFEMPLTAYPDGVISAAMSSLSEAADMVAAYAGAVGAGVGADMSAAEITAEAAESSLEGKEYGSDDGQSFSREAAITPGVRTDDGSNLFAGDAMDEEDEGAASVMYVAGVEENAPATVKVDLGDGSTPTETQQPYGTYIGEKPGSNGHYGQNDGSLPADPTRDGYTFDGWKITTPTVAYNADGTVAKELKAGDIVTGDEPWAGRIEVPEGGIGLEAQWTKVAEPDNPENPDKVVKHVVTVPESVNPNTGETVPATTLEVNEGDTLTNDQIAQIVKRGDQYPDKWDVTYYDPTLRVTQVKQGLTSDELIAFLQETPVMGDMTIVVAKDAKWGDTAPTIPEKKDTTRPAKSTTSSSAKTGDALPIVAIAGTAVVAALALIILLLIRRRRQD